MTNEWTIEIDRLKAENKELKDAMTELFPAFPDNPFSPGTQNHKIFEHLRYARAITTREIHRMGCDTARLRSDVRPILRQYGLDYRCLYIEPGNRLYEVRP